MAQAPTVPTIASLPLLERISRMQQMQTEIRELAGNQVNVDRCVLKIQELSSVILAEYAELVAAKQRSDSSQHLYSRLKSNIQEETQQLYKKALADQADSAGLWLDQKSRAEDESSYAIRSARELKAEDCNQHTAKLLAVGMKISEARDHLKQGSLIQNPATLNTASERNRRIEGYKKETFANQHQVVELSGKSTELFQLLFQPNASQSLEARNARLQAITGLQAANEQQLQLDMGIFADDTRKLLWRMDALLTFYNECVEARWQLETVYPFLIQFHNLLSKEHALSQESTPDLTSSTAMKAAYEKLKVEMAKSPKFPGTNEFYTIADSHQRPATADKKPPEFDQLKADAVKKQLQDFWIQAKGRADWLCSNILDERIGYFSKLLAQQPDNTEMKLCLQKDMEERLTFLLAEIAAMGTPPPADHVKSLLAKADALKKGLSYTNQGERFNNAITLLLAKQAALHMADYAAQFPAKMAELKQTYEPLKTQIAAARASEKAKPSLSAEEVAALEQQHKGLDNPATFEGQMKRLVDLKFASLPYLGGEKAWLTEALKCCFYTDEKAVPALTTKLSKQYVASEREFLKQHSTLTVHQDWVSINNQIRNDIAKSLNVIEDAIRAKGFNPKAATAQTVETAAKMVGYCTRYTQWWDNGPSEAPKPKTATSAPASPPNSSPENSGTSVVAPAAAGGPSSPEK